MGQGAPAPPVGGSRSSLRCLRLVALRTAVATGASVELPPTEITPALLSLAAHLLVALLAIGGMAVQSLAVCHGVAPFKRFTRPNSKYTIKNIEASASFEK